MRVKQDEKFKEAKRVCITYFANKAFKESNRTPGQDLEYMDDLLDWIAERMTNGNMDRRVEYAMKVMEERFIIDTQRIDELEETITAFGRGKEEKFQQKVEWLRRWTESTKKNPALAFDKIRMSGWNDFFNREITHVEELLKGTGQTPGVDNHSAPHL